MYKRWVIKERGDRERIRELAQSLNIDESLSNLLVQRGVQSYDEARSYFRPSLSHLHDPFLMKDMDKAVDRVRKAIDRKEKVLIYGDYDVDGTTAVALLYTFLQQFIDQIEYYVPDRYAEGYGVSYQGIDYAVAQGVSLVIVLDCGIKAVDKINYAKENGVDFIVCDHHRPEHQGGRTSRPGLEDRTALSRGVDEHGGCRGRPARIRRETTGEMEQPMNELSRQAIVSIRSDDPDDDPFELTIKCSGGDAPEIVVRGNGHVIPNGDTEPSEATAIALGSLAS